MWKVLSIWKERVWAQRGWAAVTGTRGSDNGCHICGHPLAWESGAPPKFCPSCGAAQRWPCEVCQARGEQGQVWVLRQSTCRSCGVPHIFCLECHRPRRADIVVRDGERCDDRDDHYFMPLEFGPRYPGPRGDIGGTQAGFACLRPRPWRVDLPGPIGLPVLRHGVVFVGQDNGAIQALNARDGNGLPNWQSPRPTSLTAAESPMLQVTRSKVYRLWNGELTGLSVVNGEVVFQRLVPPWVESIIAGENNVFFIGAAHAATVTVQQLANAALNLPAPPSTPHGDWQRPLVAANEDRCFFFGTTGQLLSRGTREGVQTWWSEVLGTRPVWLGVNERCGFAIFDQSQLGLDRPYRVLWFNPAAPGGELLPATFGRLHAGAVMDGDRLVVFDLEQGQFVVLRGAGSDTTRQGYLAQVPQLGEDVLAVAGAATDDDGFDLCYIYATSQDLSHPYRMHIKRDGARTHPHDLGNQPVGLNPRSGVFLIACEGGAIVGELGRRPPYAARIWGRSNA